MQFKKATRKRRKIRMAISALAGGGKTMSALRIAKGIIETEGGKIALIDTENNSSTLYDNVVDFDMVDIQPPYNLVEFNDAVALATKEKYSVLIIDSASHAWERVQEIVALNTKASKSGNSYFEWREGNKLVTDWLRNLLYFPGHVIFCMRSKMAYDHIKGDDGKIHPLKIGLAPMMRENIDFEFDMLLDGNNEHCFTVTKCRYSPFSDMVIDKPNESFGSEIVKYLNSAPEAELAEVAEPKLEPKPVKKKTRKKAEPKPKAIPEPVTDNKKHNIKQEPIDLSSGLIYDPQKADPELDPIYKKIMKGWEMLKYHDVHRVNALKKYFDGAITLNEIQDVNDLNIYLETLRMEYQEAIKAAKEK